MLVLHSVKSRAGSTKEQIRRYPGSGQGSNPALIFQQVFFCSLNELCNRLVSHGLGWPANTIFSWFPPVTKNCKHVGTNIFEYSPPNKLNQISLPTHQTCVILHDHVTVDDLQGKMFFSFFANSLVKKTWRWLATQDHAKLVYRRVSHNVVTMETSATGSEFEGHFEWLH